MKLIELAVFFRALNLYAHQAHNTCKGPTFFSDHAFFNELYSFADNKYDDLVERYIGNEKKSPDLGKINNLSMDIIKGLSGNQFESCLELISHIIGLLNATKEDKGDENLIAGIADELKVFKYKIQQRLS